MPSPIFPAQVARLTAMAQMQTLAKLRQEQLFRSQATAAERLASGDRAYEAGDFRLASVIYVRVAGTRPPNPSSMAAKERLAKLAEEARKKIKAVNVTLGIETEVSPGSTAESANSPSQAQVPAETILKAFDDFDEIASQYGGVPEVKREIASHLAKQRRKGQYAALLNEGRAKELWEMGQQYEKDDQRCCAYWAYQEGARLVPADSALRAKERFEAMKEDAEVVESAVACRELRKCHQVYQQASMLAKVKPERAVELYADILRRAPQNSELYRVAQVEYKALRGRTSD